MVKRILQHGEILLIHMNKKHNGMTHNIFISEWLEKSYKPVYEQLIEVLAELNIKPETLPYSNDVWCRDYMPVHIGGGKYVGFHFRPDYLVSYPSYHNKITDQEMATEDLNINFSDKVDLVLDGGNFVCCGDMVIMTDKIFSDNPNWRPFALLDRLEEAFQAKVILLPWDMEEEYGHADGMVAWLGEGRVLFNNYRQLEEKVEDRRFTNCVKRILDQHFDVAELKYGRKPSPDSWCYLNYLETEDAILLPAMYKNHDSEDDRAAFLLFQRIFKGKKDIKQVFARPLINKGGALHCATWDYYLP